jgi:hypothetical protein
VINAIVIVIVGNLCIAIITIKTYALATPAPVKIEQKMQVLKIMVE